MPDSTQILTAVSVAAVGTIVLGLGGYKINQKLKENTFKRTGISSHNQILETGKQLDIANECLSDFAENRIRFVKYKNELLKQCSAISDIGTVIPGFDADPAKQNEALKAIDTFMNKKTEELNSEEIKVRDSLLAAWKPFCDVNNNYKKSLDRVFVSSAAAGCADLLMKHYAAALDGNKSWNLHDIKLKNALKKAQASHTTSPQHFSDVIAAIEKSDNILELAKFKKYINDKDISSIPVNSTNEGTPPANPNP